VGYSHGKKWNDDIVIERLREVTCALELECFPTHSQINEYFGNTSLSCKISKSGGTKYWCKRMGLKEKMCESKLGDNLELFCISQLLNMGYESEKMKPRYPYDILVNNNIKIDVKSGFAFENYGDSPYYTFNLDKKYPTCDMYVVYCLNKDKTVYKTYVIPSCILYGKTQLAIGYVKSKYDKYLSKFNFIKIYDEFYKQLL